MVRRGWPTVHRFNMYIYGRTNAETQPGRNEEKTEEKVRDDAGMTILCRTMRAQRSYNDIDAGYIVVEAVEWATEAWLGLTPSYLIFSAGLK